MKFIKMKKYKLLVLTDHSNHSSENSLYALVQSMSKHPQCAQIDVATRGDAENHLFFEKKMSRNLLVSKVDESFAFSVDGQSFSKNRRQENVRTYDAIWLRMPPPLSNDFLMYLISEFPNQIIINNPIGIYKTGTKEFLTNFDDCCPPMAICKSVKDIDQFKKRFPIVLKPFRDYGGKGIVRIDGNTVWDGKEQKTYAQFVKQLAGKPINYLGVKFLKNVGEGDKRIIVVNGQILGASLRLPAKGSWICNVAQGGSSNIAEVEPAEIAIIRKIDPTLSKMGIVMYGVDTLVDDDGKRVLSEINTTSIGGLPQIAKMQNKPLVKQATDLIWEYIIDSEKRVETIPQAELRE